MSKGYYLTLFCTLLLSCNNYCYSFSSISHHCQKIRNNGIPTTTSFVSKFSPSTLTTTRYMGMWTDEGEHKTSTDRIKSCIPYMLPMLDGDQFGHYIYSRFPLLGTIDDIFVQPITNIYYHAPYLGILLFTSLTLGTRLFVDPSQMSRNVRFNAQQAALIDIALILPELIASLFTGDDELPRYVAEPSCNFVFYCYVFVMLYCLYSNLISGKKPNQIPYISAFSETMTGPL